MRSQSGLKTLGILVLMASAALAASFGTRVQIGGESADIALDEGRGLLYIANFTANRIDVMSMATNKIVRSIPVAQHPASLSLSGDARWLAVAHFGKDTTLAEPANKLTMIDISNNYSQQSRKLDAPPLGVAFGADNRALVVTATAFYLADPALKLTLLDTLANVVSKEIPVPAGTQPTEITAASMNTSRDGKVIFGVGSSSSTVTFRYEVETGQVLPGGIVLASGVFGPRVVSLNDNGSRVMAGWTMLSAGEDGFSNFIVQSSNEFGIGTSAFDDPRGLLYAQIPRVAGEDPVLEVMASDNLEVLERLKLPENATGKSILKGDRSVMYTVSESGVMVLPMHFLQVFPRLASSAPSVLLRGNFCDSAPIARTLTITNPGGGNTAFELKNSIPGVTVSPAKGRTPATVTVTVDPAAFPGLIGTQEAALVFSSTEAVNVLTDIRVFVNHAEPDQRGTILEVAGKLADILADPARDRYYILRQDNNRVLVFDGANHQLLKELRTNNAPTALAMTRDNKYLLVGHRGSQALAVFDLDTYERRPNVSTDAGGGHTVRSLAVSNSQILATAMDFKSAWHVLSFGNDLSPAVQLTELGVWENKLEGDSVAAASLDGAKILIASPNGTAYLYDANVDTFTASRNDFGSFSGPLAFSDVVAVIGTHVMNAELVPTVDLDTNAGIPSGLVFVNGGAIMTNGATAAGPGQIARFDLNAGLSYARTRTVEAPLLKMPDAEGAPSPFTHSLQALSNRQAFVSLSTSGVTVLPWNFEQTLPAPVISSVLSAADGKSPVASGSLISVLGSGMASANLAAKGTPLPTVLGDSCLAVNGQVIPLFFVSSTQINAQLQYGFAGAGTMILRTPSGKSPDFAFTVQPTAAAVFLTGSAGDLTNLPNIQRAANGLQVTGSNPVHLGDELVIYAAGLGEVTPAVVAGTPAPDPAATANAQPSVRLAGIALPLESAELVPGQIGIYRLKVLVPRFTPQGLSQPLTITGGAVTQTVKVRVVQ